MTAKSANEIQARAAARSLLQGLGIIDAPVDPAAIAKSLGIMVLPSDKLGGAFSGCLLRSGEAFGILYSTAVPNPGFQRFTIGHELGHYHLKHHHPEIFADGQTHKSASEFTSNFWHEREADHFSSELLMPKALFEKYRQGLPPGLESIMKLADRFGMSLTATAIRYSSLSPDPVVVILSDRDTVVYANASESLAKLPGVKFGIQSKQKLPKSITLEFNNDPGRVRRAERVRGVCRLVEWFDDATMAVQLNEEVIGLGSYGRTLSVLWTTVVPDPDDEEQPELDPEYFREEDGKRWRY